MHQLRTDHRRGLRRARAPMATAAAASRASPRAQRTALLALVRRAEARRNRWRALLARAELRVENYFFCWEWGMEHRLKFVIFS